MKDYLLIVLGMAIYAIGFTAFILPHEVVIGGMAGFGTLVHFATGGYVPVAVAMYVTNVLLLCCSFRLLGRRFVVRTIFGTTTLSLLIGAIERYFTTHQPIVTDPTMSVALGAVLCGLGIGVYFNHHGTAGGTDIIAAIMDKLTHVSVGRTMMMVDMSLVALSFFLPFEGDIHARIQARIQTIIYGWVSIFIYSYITDMVMNAPRQTIQFIILSEHWQEISDRLTHETGRGVTTIAAEGYWTKQQRTLMLVWCRHTDEKDIFRIVKAIDPGAYVTYAHVKGVYGNGFDPIHYKVPDRHTRPKPPKPTLSPHHSSSARD